MDNKESIGQAEEDGGGASTKPPYHPITRGVGSGDEIYPKQTTPSDQERDIMSALMNTFETERFGVV